MKWLINSLANRNNQPKLMVLDLRVVFLFFILVIEPENPTKKKLKV